MKFVIRSRDEGRYLMGESPVSRTGITTPDWTADISKAIVFTATLNEEGADLLHFTPRLPYTFTLERSTESEIVPITLKVETL